ncbi:MAG: glycosyltransferase family 2 protein [Candidatus Omnitrophota bacterium]
MRFVFWFFTGLVASVFFLYPVIIFIIARIKGKAPLLDEKYQDPFVSVIVPMHNEENVAKAKAENLLLLDYPEDRIEVLFVLDGCTDRTKEYLSEYQAKGVRVIDDLPRKGKVAALNHAVPLARGEIIVFTDANSIHKRDSVRLLVRHFSDKRTGCVSGRLVYTFFASTIVGRGENLYWKYESFIKKQESALGRLLVTSGAIQAIRKEVYPFPDPDIADDFIIPLLVQLKGYRVLYEPESIVYEPITQILSEGFEQKVRVVSQGIKGFIRLFPVLFRLGPISVFELLFHKALRWEVGIYLFLIYAANIALWDNGLYSVLLVLQTLFYVLALTGFFLKDRLKIKLFYVPFYFCIVIFSVIPALFRVMRGANTHVWEKADSTRRQEDTVE